MKDFVVLDGTVNKTFAGAKFMVQFQNGHECICSASGKMRKNMIKIMNGDSVKVEFSPYDLNNGRIIWRQHNGAMQINPI